MNDPFDILRADLVEAAARAVPASRRRRWGWVRRPSRPFVVVIAALVLGGGAAAAAVSLSASSSAPLSGRVPGKAVPFRPGEPRSIAGYRYSIDVTPNLATGASGWAVFTTYRGPGFGSGSGEGGGGGYPTLTDPIFQGSGVAPWNMPVDAQKGDSVGFVLTGPQVAAVRIGNRTIRTFASPQLPTGDRVAVFFLPSGAPLPAVGRQAGPAGPGSSTTTPLVPLDTSGHPLPTTGSGPAYGYVRGWSFWQSPRALTPNIEEPPYHGRTRPRPGVCELTQHGLPGLTPVWGSTITVLPTVRDYVGELFVSCVSTEYYLHGWPMAAAVLVDARDPGTRLGPIPGARPVSGEPSVVDFADASLSARRVGNAWLVVKGGSGTAQRLRVLDALAIQKIDLSHRTS